MALAESGGVHPASQLPLVRARAILDGTASRESFLRPALLLVYYGALVVMLTLSGYPSGRVAALAGVFAFSIAMQLWAASCKARHALTMRRLLIAQFWHAAIMTFAYALTGGLQSPMIVSYLTPLVAALIIFGGSRPTLAVAAFIGGGALVLAALPPWLRGPPVAQPWAMGITLLALFTTLAILWAGMSALLRAFHQKGSELHRAREEMFSQALERARGLEQVGSKVAHELKNPLAAIKGLVQLVSRGPGADEKTRERLAVIEKEVARMEVILREYLSFSRPLEDLRPQEVELGALAGEVLAVLEARAQASGVELAVEGTAQVQADPRRLKEALLNLGANALEATPSGGSVRVEIDEAGDGKVRIRVRDTGRGMPCEVVERLGTPFFTTREQGTGLGVTLARAVFAQHGGGLTYESTPGQGTCATALIQRAPPPPRSVLSPAVLHGAEAGPRCPGDLLAPGGLEHA